MISFRPFRQWLVTDPSRKQNDLIKKVGLNPRTAKKVWNDENINLDTVDRICSFYGLRVEQVIEWLPEKQFAVNLKEGKAYEVDTGLQVLADAECVYGEEEADRFILEQLNADVIVWAATREKALEIAQESE